MDAALLPNPGGGPARKRRSGTMVRSFIISNTRPSRPTRSWRSRTGPHESSFTARATSSHQRQEDDKHEGRDGDVQPALRDHVGARTAAGHAQPCGAIDRLMPISGSNLAEEHEAPAPMLDLHRVRAVESICCPTGPVAMACLRRL